MDSDIFQKMARRFGLRVRREVGGRWRIEGGALDVDYWPHSRTRTAHVVGTTVTAHEQDEQGVLQIAAGGWKAIPPIRRVNRKKVV